VRQAGELAANDGFDDFAPSNCGIAYDGLNITSVSGSGVVFKILLTGTRISRNPTRARIALRWMRLVGNR